MKQLGAAGHVPPSDLLGADKPISGSLMLLLIRTLLRAKALEAVGSRALHRTKLMESVIPHPQCTWCRFPTNFVSGWCFWEMFGSSLGSVQLRQQVLGWEGHWILLPHFPPRAFLTWLPGALVSGRGSSVSGV